MRRRMLGAIGGVKSAPTARDYVQDGLVAMWDGIENAGWGTHDASAIVWKDLVGGRDFEGIANAGVFEDCCFNFSKQGVANQSWSVEYKTIEVCGLGSNNSFSAFFLTRGRMFGILPTGNRGFQFHTDQPSMFQPFACKWSVTARYIDSDVPVKTYYCGEEKPHTAGTSRWSASNLGYARVQETNYPFRGKIFCVRIYCIDLTDSQILYNYEVDKARFGIA